MYAANAGKSGGELFTPPEVSDLLTFLSVDGKPEVNKVYEKNLPTLIQTNDTTKKTQLTHFPGSMKTIPKLRRAAGWFLALLRFPLVHAIVCFAVSRAVMTESHQASNSGSSCWHSGWDSM